MGTFPGLPYIPARASTGAAAIDNLIWGINIVAVVFSVLIAVGLIYLTVKYRRGHKVDRSNPPHENLTLEIAWTVIPLGLAMGLFVWSTAIFLVNKRMPNGAMEIYVVGKQWMWKLQHPEGKWEMDELHVPVGRPVKLTMTSEDVIHSFFVPEFRLHQDVVPGTYTHLWFTPSQVGTYHLFCAQFCGTNHSGMVGTVTVMDPADYEVWLRSGSGQESLAAGGARLFEQHGCSGCHNGGSVRAPNLAGIYGKPVAIQIPPANVEWKTIPESQGTGILQKVPATTITADDRYIHDSILLPDTEIAAGYYPIMPSFKGQISELEIIQLTAYIRSLGETTPSSAESSGRAPAIRTLTQDEYKARVGFTPKEFGGAGGQRGKKQ